MLQRDCESSVYQRGGCIVLALLFVSISCWILLPGTSCWSHLFFPQEICARITHSYLSPLIISLFDFLHSFPSLWSLSGALTFTLSLALSLTQYTDTHFWWPFGSKRSFKYSFLLPGKKRPLRSCLKSPYHNPMPMSSSNAATAWEWLVGPSACEVQPGISVQISSTATAPALTSYSLYPWDLSIFAWKKLLLFKY